jgi:glycosyltransferase involved in cell wall biosynthesis
MDYSIRSYNQCSAINKNKNVIKIGYAGIAGNKKDDLISFVEKLKTIELDNIELIIIGSINDETHKFLADSRIHYDFLGILNHDEAIEKLKECDCQVIYREHSLMNDAGFPTKFSESICLGLPVIATDVSDLASFSSEYVFIIRDENNSLKEFLSSLKNKKITINSEIFYHREYLNCFKKFIENIEKA